MLDEGVLASVAGADVVRYSPPLIATDDDIEMAATALGVAIDRVIGRWRGRRWGSHLDDAGATAR